MKQIKQYSALQVITMLLARGYSEQACVELSLAFGAPDRVGFFER